MKRWWNILKYEWLVAKYAWHNSKRSTKWTLFLVLWVLASMAFNITLLLR